METSGSDLPQPQAKSPTQMPAETTEHVNTPRFQTEEQLYETAIVGYNIFIDYLKDNPMVTRALRDDDQYAYEERQVGNKKIHFVGEMHFSRKPIDFMHQNLVPEIKRDPKSWLILREGGSESIDEPQNSASTFYVQELAKMFNLPYEEALADLWSPDTRKYITQRTGISEKDIDRLLLSTVLGAYSQEIKDNNYIIPEHVIERIIVFLKKPKDYTTQLTREHYGKPLEPDFEGKLGEMIKSWNDYSKVRFNEMLQKYPERTNILISTGNKHLPVFQ